MFSATGQNLESACKAWRYRQSVQRVNVGCHYCGYPVSVKRQDEGKPHFCCPACQAAHREENRENDE